MSANTRIQRLLSLNGLAANARVVEHSRMKREKPKCSQEDVSPRGRNSLFRQYAAPRYASIAVGRAFAHTWIHRIGKLMSSY